MKANSKFAAFPKSNAIKPYNDVMLEYMDHLVTEERNEVKPGGSEQMLLHLECSRGSYKKQLEILDEAMKRGDSRDILKPQEVNDLVQHLYKLKIYGKSIRDSLKAVNKY